MMQERYYKYLRETKSGAEVDIPPFDETVRMSEMSPESQKWFTGYTADGDYTLPDGKVWQHTENGPVLVDVPRETLEEK